MKKRFSMLAVAGLLVAGTASVASAEVTPMYPSGSDSAVNVYVNGDRLQLDQPAVVKNGRTLVPLRAIFEALGAEIQWDETTQTVTAERENTVIKLKLNSKVAVVEGKSVTLDVPAESINYRTMVPVRFVSEALAAHVAWDAGTSSAFVSQYPMPSVNTLGEYVATIHDPFYAMAEALKDSDDIYFDYLDETITYSQYRSQYDANTNEMKQLLAQLKALEVPNDQLTKRFAKQTLLMFENGYNYCALRGEVLTENPAFDRIQELKDDGNVTIRDAQAYEKEFSFIKEITQ